MPSNSISRRRFLQNMGVGALAGLFGPRLRAADGRKPNFLFLFTDDQTFESIHALNNPEVQTPNLDRLVKRGVVFTHCFNQGSWSGAVCICSRAMLNCGQFLYHAQKNIGTAPLWGETLTKAGYTTFLTGKWHNGSATALRSFTYGKSVGAGMYGAKDAYDRPAADEEYGVWASDVDKGGHWRPRVWDIVRDETGKPRAGKPYQVRKHTSVLYADNAVEFLQNPPGARDDPFFMYVAFNAPHDPRQSPREFLDLYDPAKIRVPPNFLPEHPFDQGDHRIRDEKLAPFPRTPKAVQVHRAEYYSIISHFDAQMGRVLDALEASGQADNTYILFSSDHGLAVGQHGLMGKQNQYDCSIRMPLIISGPGLTPGRRIDRMVYLQSLFATTCDLAGIPTPPSVEFPSLVPLLRGEDVVLHKEVFGSYKHFQRMIRTERWKLILYPMAKETQLFDLQKDPYERTDLAEKPEYAGRVTELKARLQALQKVVGDELDLDNPNPPVRVTNKGYPVKADEAGVFRLVPAAAHTSGQLVYQPKRNNLGAWFRASDTPSWQVQAVPAGKYRVRFAYGSTQRGVPYVIEIGKRKLAGTTSHTGGIKTYQWFELGTVDLPAGDTRVVVRPGAFKGAFGNFRGIELVPEVPR
jgi:choline-sulfatase